MSLLLDTQIIIWLAHGDAELPDHVRDHIAKAEGVLCVSVVSGWEYGIKRARYPDQLPDPFERLLMSDYRRLDLDFTVHGYAEDLPPIHRDPFDRMLIAQALTLNLTLVTADRIVRSYPVPTFW